MLTRRDLPYPPQTLRAARLVDGEIRPLIGSSEPELEERRELVELWDRLSQHGRAFVLTAARSMAKAEGLPQGGAPQPVRDGESA